MKPREFLIDANDYGLPTRDELVSYRIWDDHFHGFYTGFGAVYGNNPIDQYERTKFFVERMGIEHSISLEVGGTLEDPLSPYPYDAEIVKILERDKDRLSGLTPIDPADPDKSLAKMEKWIRNGPCIGIKYPGNAGMVTCSHPNNDPIIRLVRDLEAVAYVHTWLKVGGTPRLPGGGNVESEPTPMDLAKLAQRFPDVWMICGHSGGDWELGVRAIRPFKNVFLEFAGSDPHSGMVELAIRELGVDRLVWGGHGPSRSYATELGKVLDADISEADRMKILGGNLRRICAPIFRKKGRSIEL